MDRPESTIEIPIWAIEERAHYMPDGYLQEILNSGEIINDRLQLKESIYSRLRAKYNSLGQQTINIFASLTRWIAAGLPVVPPAVLFDRSCHCWLCPQWDARAQRCLACGCYSLKHWLATEKCPLGKWDAISDP